jgi:hypothetical protein
MTLLKIQRQMSRAILQPLTSSNRISQSTDSGFIKPNGWLTSVERLEIYSRSYWFRVLDSLYDDFPGLRAVLGEKAFHRLSRAYLADCPSRSFTLRNLGSRLTDWLQRNPDFAGDRLTLAVDMARLEWAHIEAFDGTAEKALGLEDLQQIDAAFRAALQPYIRILDLQYPVDNLRIQVNRESDEHEAASNTALRRRSRTAIRHASRLNPTRIFLAVHRRNDAVYYRRIGREEYHLLGAIGRGEPIGKAIQDTFGNSLANVEERESMLETCCAVWAELGWLCLPKRKTVGTSESCNF